MAIMYEQQAWKRQALESGPCHLLDEERMQWNWPAHRVWLPRSKQTYRHRVQKTRASSSAIQVIVSNNGSQDRWLERGWMFWGSIELRCHYFETLHLGVKNPAEMMIISFITWQYSFMREKIKNHKFLTLCSGEISF